LLFQGDLGDFAVNWLVRFLAKSTISLGDLVYSMGHQVIQSICRNSMCYIIWLSSGKKVHKHSSKICDVGGGTGWWAWLSLVKRH